jgi:hypothetical protein
MSCQRNDRLGADGCALLDFWLAGQNSHPFRVSTNGNRVPVRSVAVADCGRASSTSVVQAWDEMPERKQRLRVVDDGRVGETYANRLISTSFDGGAICITLGVVRLVPEHTGVPAADGEPHVHVTVRLTLSPGTAVDLIKSLNDVLGAARGEQRGPQAGKHAH